MVHKHAGSILKGENSHLIFKNYSEVGEKRGFFTPTLTDKSAEFDGH